MSKPCTKLSAVFFSHSTVQLQLLPIFSFWIGIPSRASWNPAGLFPSGGYVSRNCWSLFILISFEFVAREYSILEYLHSRHAHSALFCVILVLMFVDKSNAKIRRVLSFSHSRNGEPWRAICTIFLTLFTLSFSKLEARFSAEHVQQSVESLVS